MAEALPADDLLRHLHYSFGDPTLLGRALTHATYAFEHPGSGGDNERLEFIGDAVLGLVAADLLYRRYPAAAEGELSRRRARLVRRETLADLAREVGLGSYLRLGTGERRAGGATATRILADAYEALIGALYLDGGIAAVQRALGGHLGRAIERLQTPLDFKTRLQEVAHRAGKPGPRYAVLRLDGPPHKRHYTCEVRLDDGVLGTGEGSSKRAAEQLCARQALVALGEPLGE